MTAAGGFFNASNVSYIEGHPFRTCFVSVNLINTSPTRKRTLEMQNDQFEDTLVMPVRVYVYEVR